MSDNHDLDQELPRPKPARRRSREFALQGLYQWRVGGADAAAIEGHLPQLEDFAKADRNWLEPLLTAVADNTPLLVKGEEGLILPGQQHVAELALGKGDSGTAGAGVEHRHVAEQRSDVVLHSGGPVRILQEHRLVGA